MVLTSGYLYVFDCTNDQSAVARATICNTQILLAAVNGCKSGYRACLVCQHESILIGHFPCICISAQVKIICINFPFYFISQRLHFIAQCKNTG